MTSEFLRSGEPVASQSDTARGMEIMRAGDLVRFREVLEHIMDSTAQQCMQIGKLDLQYHTWEKTNYLKEKKFV